MRQARIETPRPSDVTGSLGSGCAEWVAENLGYSLKPWQAYAAERILETKEDGSLRWQYVLLTVPRQSGKSWLMRSLAAWRCYSAQHFGEPQTVLHIASRRQLARTVWRGVAKYLDDNDEDVEVRYANGQEALELPDGSEWLIAAASVTGIPGVSVSLALVDEAWQTDTEVVEAALMPTQLARKEPQLLLVSTAGDSTSELMAKYREIAMGQMQDPDDADWLILEWSANPAKDYWDEEAWLEASPEWDDNRYKQVRSSYRTMDENAFRMQLLNQWTRSVSGWITESVWGACAVEEFTPSGSPGCVAVESGVNGLPIGYVHAVPCAEGKVHVSARQFETYPDLFKSLQQLCDENRGIEVLRHRALKLPPFTHSTELLVGSTEQLTGYARVRELVGTGQLLHSNESLLNEHVLVANTHTSSEGREFLSQKKSGAPIFLARAMIWAVDRVMDPSLRKYRAAVVSV